MALSNSLDYLNYGPNGQETAQQQQQEITAANAIALVYTVSQAADQLSVIADSIKSLDFDSTDIALGDYDAGSINRYSVLRPVGVGVSGFSSTAITADVAATLPLDAPVYQNNAAVFTWNENLWDTELLDASKVKLLQDLLVGGYGIEPQDEADLWERERERELANGTTAANEAARQFAARGFKLPPGALNAALSQANQTTLEKNSSVSRDIALKRADMYVENRKFTFQMAVEVEKTLIDYASAYFGRQLEAAKAQLQAYETSVGIFNAQISAFVAKYSVRDATVRNQLEIQNMRLKDYQTRIEKYKADLENAISTYNANIDKYKADISLSGMFTQGDIALVEARTKNRQSDAQIALSNAQIRMEGLKAKGSALQAAAALYAAPTNAYTQVASAYINSMTNIAATIA